MGILPAKKRPFDIKDIIARLVDGSKFHEFKELRNHTGVWLRGGWDIKLGL